MAADSGRIQASHAAQVCIICKARKKKCDKALPRCGFCARNGIECRYKALPPRQRNYIAIAQGSSNPSFPSSSSSLYTISPEPAASETTLYLQIHNLIRSTGQFVDDVTAYYFKSVHRYLPFISRTRFQSSLITLGSTPSAEFSALLLSICLVTSSPKLTGDVTKTKSLYLAAKSIFAQVQGPHPPSVCLIQAGLLLALYEYIARRPDEAFTSIAGCARMAYAARIHVRKPSLPDSPDSTNMKQGTGADVDLEYEEAANTWWALIICERAFFHELTTPEQPLITRILGGDVELPTEPAFLEQSSLGGSEPKSHLTISSLKSAEVGAFGRVAQAAWLHDEILKASDISSPDSRLRMLQSLDSDLQALLVAIMQLYDGRGSVLCQTIAATIRSLFTLHWRILDEPTNNIKDQPAEEWRKRSQIALGTATKLVLDVAESNCALNPGVYPFSSISLGYSYMIQAALTHIYGKPGWKDDDWLSSAEQQLRSTLSQYNRYWNVETPIG
ncbi:hypothetical protein NM208_g7800 [Fusarium decemcellulare]|uniref:Uncharacterized protein n=1 Tax=Fusarium decemcellulare TaxID=57161 RepID=A0ACC1S7S3_9HYPO|nr:hypothetical protein NM208_g7800 [Fusarium decemcellulare]